MKKDTPVKDLSTVPYSEAYKERVFVAWYSAGCPVGERLALCAPEDENGRTPTITQLHEWMRKLAWRERADILNAEVAKEIERKAVEVRVEMLSRQAELGKDLQMKGKEYLDEHPFEKAGEALKAIIQGAELERASRGLPDALLKVAEMKDEDLGKVLSSLLGKVGADQLEEALTFDVEAEILNAPEDNESSTE